jgi:general secretion pathway protein D
MVKTMRIRRLLIGALLLPVLVSGQFIGGGDTTPWTSFKLNPKTRINLNFHNANVDAVIGLLSKTSGVTIVKDPALTGAITVTSAKPVGLNDAFQILATTLSLKGFNMSKQGNLLVIKNQNQGRGGRNGGGTGGFDISQIPPGIFDGGQQSTELKVFPITYANASQLARVINDVFATSGQQTNPFAALFGGGGAQGGRGNPFQQGGRGGGFQFGNRGQSQSSVRASSDDFSNSVIVNAPGNMMDQVGDIIRKLDKQTEDIQAAKVYKLTYATASLLAPTVQNVLTANAPKGRGGISGQNVPIEQRFQQAMRFGSAQAAFGTVVADDRTNSLVVTATPENQELVSKVIADLDTDVPIQNTTFVFPLSNARASDIATLMQQAFGTRQGGTGGRTGNNTGRPNTNQPRRNTGGGGGGGGLGGGLGGGRQAAVIDPDGKNLDLALADPDADSGELMTSIGVQQGGGFGGFFGGGQRGQQGTNQMGRDAQGRPVNIRDLQNQITVIPDPNTNSLIVVTTPDNVQLIQSILDQLDKIPEQVMIETMIIEATLDSSSQFGVEWNFVQNKAFGNNGTTGNAGAGFGLQNATPPLQGFKYTLAGGDLGVFLNALKSDTKFQVLSTPRIFTSNNVEAEINISQSIPYVVSTREDANGNLTFNYQFQDVGIVLTVTPHITANGYVTMDVDQTANDLQGFTSFNAPIVNQRQATTTVSVKDGETIILGGIIRKNVTSTVKKVPLLGDIPILGQLFRSTSKSDIRTELMVFLTPRVVRNPEDARVLREKTTKNLTPQSQKSLKNAIPPTAGDGHKTPPPPAP